MIFWLLRYSVALLVTSSVVVRALTAKMCDEVLKSQPDIAEATASIQAQYDERRAAIRDLLGNFASEFIVVRGDHCELVKLCDALGFESAAGPIRTVLCVGTGEK